MRWRVPTGRTALVDTMSCSDRWVFRSSRPVWRRCLVEEVVSGRQRKCVNSDLFAVLFVDCASLVCTTDRVGGGGDIGCLVVGGAFCCKVARISVLSVSFSPSRKSLCFVIFFLPIVVRERMDKERQ